MPPDAPPCAALNPAIEVKAFLLSHFMLLRAFYWDILSVSFLRKGLIRL
jgi:hypothetical protein